MRKPPSSSFPWLPLSFAVAGMGAVWYLLFKQGGATRGTSVWQALGFPYGPSGNLTSVGNQFFSGQNRYDGKNAVPIILGQFAPLRDNAGNILTDNAGNVLTDQSIINPLGLPRNNSRLLVKYNSSGSRPS